MTQRDRDRLVVLKKAQKKLITQKQAAAELGLTERHVRRLLRQLKSRGDKAVIHALRGRSSNRKLSQEVQQKILAILAQDEYKDFGPTAASEELANRHQIRIGREALRQLLIESGRWRAKKQKVEKVHSWRQRRSCRGELVQWDTSEHDWLEGRGDKLYLIAMIDDASSELTARFALHDSTEENMLLLRDYLEKNGRPVAFYTDKASLFQTAPKIARDQKALPRDEREPLPPTQIGRALQELQIAWIAAHSPQAKGRIERAFATAQDRLVKGLRLAGATTLEQANQYLQLHFVPWWNETLKVLPANATDAHRPLGPDHQLPSALSHVEARTVGNDYTFRYAGKLYQIAADSIRHGLRGGTVRVERRLDGSLAVRFAEAWLAVSECQLRPKAAPAKAVKPRSASATTTAQRTAAWRRSNDDLFRPTINVHAAAAINRTRTQQRLD
jgi:transposase